MATQINPKLARLWLADNIRQYGYRNPLKLHALTEAELRLLDYLEAGITCSQIAALPQIARIEEGAARELVRRLGPALISSGKLPPDLTKAQIDTKFAEISRLFSVDANFDEALDRRRSARIFIEELGRTGLVLAKALAASEIGTLMTLDQVRVGPKDCLPLGHSKSSIGQPRALSAKSQLETTRLEFHSRRTSALEKVSVAVLISDDIVNPRSYQPWMARDVPHLAMCFDEEGVEISPLVFPGETPCLGCREKARFDADSSWSTIAPQLLAIDRSNQESAMVLFATGVVTNQILNFVDESKRLENRTLRLDRSGSLLAFHASASHCGCGASAS